jgi:Ni,Fe-hydrogenase I large subunit
VIGRSGVGPFEAPCAALGPWLEIAHGTIRTSQIISPSSWTASHPEPLS